MLPIQIKQGRQVSVPASADFFQCPITMEIMDDPVVATDGYTYNRPAITQWLAQHKTSPMTGQLIVSTQLIPNRDLRSQIMNSGLLVCDTKSVQIDEVEIITDSLWERACSTSDKNIAREALQSWIEPYSTQIKHSIDPNLVAELLKLAKQAVCKEIKQDACWYLNRVNNTASVEALLQLATNADSTLQQAACCQLGGSIIKLRNLYMTGLVDKPTIDYLLEAIASCTTVDAKVAKDARFVQATLFVER